MNTINKEGDWAEGPLAKAMGGEAPSTCVACPFMCFLLSPPSSSSHTPRFTCIHARLGQHKWRPCAKH